MKATVVITTKNRREELAVALRSCVAQVPLPEIVVVDDGSTDGTSDFVAKEFPDVVLVRHSESKGCIVRRNEGARIATGDVVVSIDDDAAFTMPNIVADCLKPFECERVGGVAIPYVDVKTDGLTKQLAPDDQKTWVAARFIGTAHALRRNVFLDLGGYRETLIHQGEESDYCIRMLEAGWVVALGGGAPIHHFESPRRDFSAMDYYGPRNTILFAYQNIPAPYVLARLPLSVIQVLLWTMKLRRLRIRTRGVIDAFKLMTRTERRPVSIEAYRRYQTLSSRGPLAIDDVLSPIRRN